MFVNVALVLGTFLFMEGVAWFTHRYIMHGFLWNWHHDHHNHHKGFFEINDLFAVVFAITAIALIGTGVAYPELDYLTWIGAGVTLYGFFYFVFHDIIVHRRVKVNVNTNGRYMQRIMRRSLHSPQSAYERRSRSLWFSVRTQKIRSTRKNDEGGV